LENKGQKKELISKKIENWGRKRSVRKNNSRNFDLKTEKNEF